MGVFKRPVAKSRRFVKLWAPNGKSACEWQVGRTFAPVW